MLRPYFLHHRELLGRLARAAWETVLQLMVAATSEETLQPGLVCRGAVTSSHQDPPTVSPHER